MAKNYDAEAIKRRINYPPNRTQFERTTTSGHPSQKKEKRIILIFVSLLKPENCWSEQKPPSQADKALRQSNNSIIDTKQPTNQQTNMPRHPAKLSHCYVPLPLPQREEHRSSRKQLVRSDGRSTTHELRRLCLETSVISNAMGSALVELGHTKVLAEIQIAAAKATRPGTTTARQQSNNNNNEATTEKGSLRCNISYAPHIGINQVVQQSSSVSPLDGTTSNNNNNSSNQNSTAPTISSGKLHQELAVREANLSRKLTEALLPVVVLEQYPKCTLVINITILQDDGSCLSAAITAASMALVDARVELRDMVTSCTVAVIENPSKNNDDDDSYYDEEEDDDEDYFLYLADPTQDEVPSKAAVICLAMTPNHKEVTLWSQSGKLSSAMASVAMELCRDGCRTMHKFMRESWISTCSKEQQEMAVQ